VVHTNVCGQTAECEVSISFRRLILVSKIDSVLSHMTGNFTRINKCNVQNHLTVYITVRWMYGLTALLLVMERRNLVVVPEVTIVLLLPL
jgi:hypothetical protein